MQTGNSKQRPASKLRSVKSHTKQNENEVLPQKRTSLKASPMLRHMPQISKQKNDCPGHCLFHYGGEKFQGFLNHIFLFSTTAGRSPLNDAECMSLHGWVIAT